MTTSSSRLSLSILGALLGAGALLSACGSSESTSSATGSGGNSTSSAGGGSAASTGATTSGGGGESGSTGSSAASSSSTGTGGPADCTGLPLCDDFEAAVVGGPPDAATWTIVSPSCSGAGTVSVDGTQAHSGTKSVKVTGKGGYCDHVFLANTAAITAVGKSVYGRFFLRLSDPLGAGHTTLLTLKDAVEGKDLRLGGQNQVLIWNRESDDATLPELSPTGTALSVSLPALAWRCVEFHIDESDGQMQTWVDGADVAGLHQDGVPTQDIDKQWLNKSGWKPDVTDLKLGWESYAGQEMTLWFDDVAIGATRIGCD
jgi:hypothetical protein